MDDHRRCICVYVVTFRLCPGGWEKAQRSGSPEKIRRWGNRSLVGFDPRSPLQRVSGVTSTGNRVDSQNLDMTTTLPHFSIPARDETMAPLGSHE